MILFYVDGSLPPSPPQAPKLADQLILAVCRFHIKTRPHLPAIWNCALTLTKRGYILDPVMFCQHYLTNTEMHGKTKFWVVMWVWQSGHLTLHPDVGAVAWNLSFFRHHIIQFKVQSSVDYCSSATLCPCI